MGFTTRKITFNWPISAEFVTFPNIVPNINHRREITFSLPTKVLLKRISEQFALEIELREKLY